MEKGKVIKLDTRINREPYDFIEAIGNLAELAEMPEAEDVFYNRLNELYEKQEAEIEARERESIDTLGKIVSLCSYRKNTHRNKSGENK